MGRIDATCQKRMDLLGHLGCESRNKKRTYKACDCGVKGGNKKAVLLSWLYSPNRQKDFGISSGYFEEKRETKMKRKWWMGCGVMAAILAVGVDLVTGIMTPGYSFYSQTISELSAVHAPYRTLWQIVTFIQNPMLIVFGGGIVNLASGQKRIRMMWLGKLIMVWGSLGFLWLLTPMNVRGEIGSTTDTMHLIMTGITVLLIIVLMIVGARVGDRRFYWYTWGSLALMMVAGILTGRQTEAVALNMPTPGMGITERISAYAPMIWLIVLTRVIKKI